MNFTGSAVWLYVGDFNGDGKTDIASVGSATQTNIHSSTGSNFVPVQTASQTVGRTDTAGDGFRMFYLGDFDGDGKTDLMNGYTSGEHYYQTIAFANLTQGPFPDLITTIDNGFGSQTLLSYKSIVDESVYSTDAGTIYAAVYPEKEFQQPIYVVSDRTITDGKGASYPHTYTYGGGKIHQLGRGWLGFRWRETLDLSTKSLTKEFLNQAFPFIGTASETETHDASFAGNTQLFAEVWQTYKNPPPQPHTGVYFVQLERTDHFEWDGQGSPRQTARTMEYDSANNPTRTFHLGDLSVSGDEQDERTDWATNITSDIFIHRPIRSSLHQGSYQTGTLLREKWLYYDGLGYGVIGNAGLLSKEEARLAQSGGPGSGGHVITTHGYDGFGNRNSTTDARQCTTTTTYESTHQTYPQTVIACAGDLNHQTDLIYEAKFGVIKSRTDPHNPATDNPVPTTTWDYDLLGRLTKITGPLDGSSQHGTVSHQYLNWGNPNSQQIVTRRTEQHGGSAVLTSWEFFDGLRRTYRTEQEGPAGQNILIETVFDSRGLPVSKSAPRFSGETSVNTLIAYDILGRVKRVTNGDGTFITKTYNRGTVTTVNERGKPKTESFDAFGRLKQVVEYNGSQAYETDYLYDAAGSLLKVTNAFGHDSSVMTYDLLGRKATMVDKSMGSWSYEYWPAGDLKKQTDARGTALDFTYDGLAGSRPRRGSELSRELDLRRSRRAVLERPAHPGHRHRRRYETVIRRPGQGDANPENHRASDGPYHVR